ncbi:MAG: hypothetical protein WDA07_13205 [Leucobacter sp.]
MTVFTSLDSLIYTVIGALILWLAQVLKHKWRDSTQERRRKIDKQAAAERRARLLTESLHEHRSLMLQSGKWTRATLPPFLKE